ncbi:hypothetical protein LTR97_002429 [Elasticomyces elasticus]|uniref:AB hydrolase-1 domain-containing protein n=1 Tax=Elasticomyces elasticus TaxID=574655 RepID=A0AAN7ZVM3_9PEZI|nr:hypothetical protein LTR97_002429 [Elasticomyces elasticus]
MSNPDKRPTFVLVHGAWHEPSHFQSVTALLKAAGYKVEGVSLPSVGHLDKDPGNGLELDSAAVADALRKVIDSDRDVVLVAHSYGGIPTSEAAAIVSQEQEKATDPVARVVKLIYLAAYVPPKGASLVTESAAGQSSTNRQPTVSENGLMAITAENAIHVLYNTTPAVLAEEAAAKLRPIALSSFVQTTKFCGWADYGIPDKAMPPSLQQDFAARIEATGSASETVWLDSDHSPFLHMPEQVAELLLAAAA